MFGTKIIYLKLRNEYSVEEFYEKIKNENFEAGCPALIKQGPAALIAFPPPDFNNQVQILRDRKGRFCVMRSAQPLGFDKLPENSGPGEGADGLSELSSVAESSAKLCNRQVEKTAEHIKAMEL